MSKEIIKTDETKVVTGVVRFSYANVFVPKAIAVGAEEKYSIVLLIPKSDVETVAKIKAAIQAAAKQGVAKFQSWGGNIPATLKHPLRDGDAEKPDDPTYEGCYFINANAKTKPGVLDGTRKDPATGKYVTIESSVDFYSGCYGMASINFFPYSQLRNNGVGCGLNNLLKTKDGMSLGGRRSAQEDFSFFDNPDAAFDGLNDEIPF
jgi:Protein of unknown function (DUF2815)